jgi:hypothetical protein
MHPWMTNNLKEDNQKSLLVSFFLVDDLQEKGKLTKVFFELRQTKVNVCKIFINQIIKEMMDLYQKLEILMTKTIKLEKKLEKLQNNLKEDSQELLEHDWKGLFSACFFKMKSLFEKINDLRFQMSNKHVHMMYNYFMQSRRKMKSYEICCGLIKSIEERLETNFSSLQLNSRTNLDDYDTANQSEANSNVKIQEGLLNCVEILQKVVLREYLKPCDCTEITRDILVDCFDILSFDITELSYSINYNRSLAGDIPNEVYSISYFLGNIHKINELDSRSSKSFQSEDSGQPSLNFQRNQFNVYKNNQILINEPDESGCLFEEDEQMQKIANLVKIKVNWVSSEVFRKKSIQNISKRLFDMFREFDFKKEKSVLDSVSLVWSDFSEEESGRKESWVETGNKDDSISEFN